MDKNNTDRVIRYWKSSPYKHGGFKYSWHPPHPTFFVRKWVYDKYGFFNSNFKISADYELMLRFLEKDKITTYYIPEVIVKIHLGGKSNCSIKNILLQSWEDYRAWSINNVKGGVISVIMKKIKKAPQFINKHPE